MPTNDPGTDPGAHGSGDIAAQVAALPWYHSITLPGGITTPGVVQNARVLPRLQLPASFAGKSVLDIGAWDGFYSFEAARRGAADVLAADSFSWDGRGWGRKASFEFARRTLGLEGTVRDRTIDPTELTPEALGGQFDVVFLLGVLYHLEDPIGVLRRVASVCKGLLVLETEATLNWLPFPAARVFPGAELNGDPTNWYQYNERALVGLLKEVGFAATTTVYKYPVWRRFARAGRDRIKGKSFRAAFYSSRIVIHATKG
ncbi:MAG: methyltransferase domain-containing protein [Actinomycetota bacterium]